jgi:hypothetical protein
MNAKDRQILELQTKILKLETENNYLKSSLHTFEITEDIRGYYNILLNPPLREFRTTKAQKQSVFMLNMNHIVCIKSDGKIKNIHFNKEQTSISGERFVSRILSFNGTIQSFRKKYDTAEIHICEISKSEAVNVFYYSLNAKKVELDNKEVVLNDKCNSLTISPKYIERFIERKQAIKNFISYQNL